MDEYIYVYIYVEAPYWTSKTTPGKLAELYSVVSFDMRIIFRQEKN